MCIKFEIFLFKVRDSNTPTNECDCRRACRADLAAAAFVAFRLVSVRLLRALCFPSIVIGLTV